jgi:hypothetical protein
MDCPSFIRSLQPASLVARILHEKILDGGVNESGARTAQKPFDKTYDESPKRQPSESRERHLKELGHMKFRWSRQFTGKAQEITKKGKDPE